MNEIFDKILIQLIFLTIIFLIVFIYNMLYSIFYSEQHRFILKKFYPAKNSPHTIHYFGRIFALIFILGNLSLSIQANFFTSILHFTTYAFLLFILFTATHFILDAILLAQFEFEEEIFIKKNFSYAIITTGHSLIAGYLLYSLQSFALQSILNTIFLWLLAMVIIGISLKFFHLLFKQSLLRHVIQKNISITLSYLGYLSGNTLLTIHAIPATPLSFDLYALTAFGQFMQMALFTALIMFLFNRLFRIQVDYKGDLLEDTDLEPQVGTGFTQGATYYLSCYIAVIITTHINFGIFYPVLKTLN